MIRRDDLARDCYALAIEAIDRGERERAKKHLAHMKEEWRLLHDMYGDAEGVLLTFIAERLGEKSVDEAHRYVAETLWKPLLIGLKDHGIDALIEALARFLRAHGYEFTCAEDDEKYVFVLDYCPTGGRIVKEGKIDTSGRHALAIGTTKRPYSWSFDRKGISYYCCHCPLWMHILPKEWGWDVLDVQFGDKADGEGRAADEPCKMIVYKQARVG